MQGTQESLASDSEENWIESVIDEQRLIEQAIKRDQNAFACLYDVHVGPVFRHVYDRLGHRSDAEDVTAEVFLRAWQAIEKYRFQGAPFRAWLFRIANNLIIDRRRATKDRVPLDEFIADFHLSNDPVAVAEMNLTRSELRRAILRLKPEQQQVIIMRFVDGLGYDEVAGVLAKSEGAVRVIQYRALRELRVILESSKGVKTLPRGDTSGALRNFAKMDRGRLGGQVR